MKPVDSILDLVGNTPIVKLARITEPGAAAIYVKLEFLNPGGSVKDRLGAHLIRVAEKAGFLKKGGTVIEPTAGNTGIGLALAGAQMGYRVILVVPEGFSEEKVELMKALGGEVVRTPKADGILAAIARADELAKTIPGAYVPQQFRNPANSDAHYETTGPEIWEQMDGHVDAYVAGSGTGGTFTGAARYLKEKNPDLYAVIVEPQGSVLTGGCAGPHEVEGIGSSFIPPVLDMSLASEIITVVDPPAFAMVARLAAEESILSGSSGGANVVAALQIARKLGPGKRVVTIIPDSSERYLSKGIYSKWRKGGTAMDNDQQD
ncbi:MAG TPA: cysteine synthase A [Thermoanaerobaculia bacterium]|nr:cysteine synthase A [Thermoanaerobaculia bacterium]